MSDIMRPVPFTELIERIFTEYRNHGSIFGISKETFYRGGKNSIDVFNQKCTTALGPAAGPHTQLAQNIISSYLTGGRFIELKTVQIMDYLGEKNMISKPCIDARDEGYNVEWSTEFTLEKAYDEYLKAWFVLNLLQALLNGKYDGPDFIFNMSVGYNLEGIKQPKMQAFINGLIDAESNPLFFEYKDQLRVLIKEEEFYCGSDFEKNSRVLEGLENRIPASVCKSVTVSTMHGCPPDEIEAICSYMLKEKHLNTFVKLNPTLLGYEKVRSILDSIGFDYIELKKETFTHDLQLDDAFVMLHKLLNLAKSLHLGFGVKLTNTLANVNNENVFEGDERYMSGRALLPVSTKVAAIISKEFGSEMPVSYSGGANVYSVKALFESGIRPITLATDMLKPGGYTRMKAMADILDGSNGWNVKAVNSCAVEKLSEDALRESYSQKMFRGNNKAKINDKLPLFDCFISPCMEACPINQCIPEYVKLVSEGKYKEALRLIYRDNALPNITCNICDHQCQLHCSRMDYEGPVAVRDMKKIAVEQGFDDFIKSFRKSEKSSDVKVVVIGAGPAGLSAAFFLSRAGIDVTVFEKESCAGGVVANIIPDFRIARESIDADVNYIKGLGAEFVFGAKTEDETVSALKSAGYKYIIYAVGSGVGNPVKLEGDSSCVTDGLEFLKAFKAGKAVLGKNVVVEGAGNSAMDCARAALRCKGVENVSIVYRRSIKEMPASYDEYLEALEEGVRFNFLTNPVKIADGTVSCMKMKLGEIDSSGRRSPVETGEYVDIKCDSLILALGEHVDSSLVSEFGLSLNEKKWPVVDSSTGETSVEDVFAIGDMSFGPSTVVRCIESARRTCDYILDKLDVEYISDEDSDELSDDEYFEEEDRIINEIKLKKASILPSREKLVSDFRKFAKQEGSRCMDCTYMCSKCVDVCPNRANVAVDMRYSENSYDAFQIVHLDAYCNECGNCATFCNHNGKPYRDKFTLFSLIEDFENSSNDGFIVDGNDIKVRIEGKTVDCSINGNGKVVGNIPPLVKDLIEEIFISYGYLLGRVDV